MNHVTGFVDRHDRRQCHLAVVTFAHRPFARAIHEPLPGDVRPSGTTHVLRVYDDERHNNPSIDRGRTGRMPM